MTRDEWVNTLEDDNKVSFLLNTKERRELADLLREPYVNDWLLADIKALRDRFGTYSYSAFRDELKAIIERLTPPPKVEWVDRGVYSIAEVRQEVDHGSHVVVRVWSLLVQEQNNGTFVVFVRRDKAADTEVGDNYNTPSEAKRAAESRLHQLMRGAK